VKEKIKRIIEKIKDIFSLHCPKCGAKIAKVIELEEEEL
jgi:hypothetical protein